MGLYYRFSRFLLFCTNQLQKDLRGYIRKVWILSKAMTSNRYHKYFIWQKRCHGQCRNRNKKSLIYLVVLLINLGVIVLIFTSTITLIKNQEKKVK